MCSRCVFLSTSRKRNAYHGRPSAKARSTHRALQLRCVPFKRTSAWTSFAVKGCHRARSPNIEIRTAREEAQDLDLFVARIKQTHAHVQSWNACMRGMRGHIHIHNAHTHARVSVIRVCVPARVLCARVFACVCANIPPFF